MSLPYESATSGERALGEIQKLLRGFGCSKFGSMIDDADGTVLVQFEYRGRPVSVKASTKGYAAAWLRAHEYGPRVRCTLAQHQRKALDIASVAVYSILRDWIKGQITAIVKQIGEQPRGWCASRVHISDDDNADLDDDYCDFYEAHEQGKPCPGRCGALVDRKGGDPAEWPEHLRVREFPLVADAAARQVRSLAAYGAPVHEVQRG